MLFCPRLRASAAPNSEVEHQPVALAAGAADHDLGVRGLLLLGEDGVAMLRRAGDHPLLAGAANHDLAGIVVVEASIEEDLEDALSVGDDKFLSVAGEFIFEAALLVH